MTTTGFTAEERALIDVWERHMAAEFERHDADEALGTMTDTPVLTHVPVATGATGREALRAFYAKRFCPFLPADAEIELLTRTVGQNRIVDEFVLCFTHTVRMDWLAAGVEPTARRLTVPHVAVIQFENGKIASERIYWDQATVLVQLGLLDAEALPVMGAEQARRLTDPSTPANRLIDRLSAAGER